MWEGSGRHQPQPVSSASSPHHGRVDRQKSCPPERLSGGGLITGGLTQSPDASIRSGSNCSTPTSGSKPDVKGAGKRFARRAKRWAELQQRRQNARQQRADSDSLPRHAHHHPNLHQIQHHHHQHYYDVVELHRMASGILSLDDNSSTSPDSAAVAAGVAAQHLALGARRSLPYSLLQTRHHEVPVIYSGTGHNADPSKPVYVGRGVNEFGQPTCISVYHTNPELTVYAAPPRSRRASDRSGTGTGRNAPSYGAHLSSDSDSVSLLASDVSNVCLSTTTSSDGGSSSPLSTSISSRTSESDESSTVFIYPSQPPASTPPHQYSSALTHHHRQHHFHSISTTSKMTILEENVKFYSSSLHRSNILTPLQPFVRDNEINTHPPPDRSWMMIRHADPDRPIATFTVLCYNVLCDKYATAAQYSYCPSWALNWEYRKNAIIKEIRNYEADIITLQEVETEQYRLLFQPELKSLGYAALFSPKSRAKTMNEEEKKYVDGCAIFWKADKFELDRDRVIEFTQVAIQKAQTSEHMLNRVMPRDNIALCAVLRVKENVYNRRVNMQAMDNVIGCPLVVCTAHIHWDPEFCDVKLIQCIMLTSELGKLLHEVGEKFRMNTSQVPVLICGDLNSLPDSGVFEFLAKGQISRQHPDLKSFKDDPCLDKFSSSGDTSHYTHALRLDSSIDIQTVQFTNYTLDFKGVIDYIFSTPQSLARLGVLGSFNMDWIQQNKIIGFPHPHVPSDHIPLMAQYAIIPSSHQRPTNAGGTPNHSAAGIGLIGVGGGGGGGAPPLPTMQQHHQGAYGGHGFGQLGFGR